MISHFRNLHFDTVAAVILVSFIVSLAGSSATVSQAAIFGNAGIQAVQTTTTGDGLRIVTIDSTEGRVIVKLPDDIRTGDTISGTLIGEPKGTSKEEQAKNQAAMRAKIIRLMLTRVKDPFKGKLDKAQTVDQGSTKPVMLTVPLSGGDTSTVQTLRGSGNVTRIEFKVLSPGDFGLEPDGYKSSDELGRVAIPIDTAVIVGPKKPPTPTPTPVKKTPGQRFLGDVIYSTVFEPKPPPTFFIPPLGQTGHPIQIAGPFDGSSANTSVSLTTPKTSIPGSKSQIEVIAESPRKAVVDVPEDFKGLGRIVVNEGNAQTSSPFRNVRVDLTAPKTSLLKGESTELHVQVTGLAGITEPIPLTLESRGVITMSGGPYQPLTINPSQIGVDGSYATTRTITGLQAGGWGATATVVVPDCFLPNHYYDFLARDDHDPGISFWMSSFNGDFEVTPPDGPSFSGTGTVKIKGCEIDLNFDKRGFMVEARIDACAKTATATVQEAKPKVKFTITDRNTTDNTCAMQ